MPSDNDDIQTLSDNDDMSSDDELPQIYIDEVPTRIATLEGYEARKTAIRSELDSAPNMAERELRLVANRFDELANAVVSVATPMKWSHIE